MDIVAIANAIGLVGRRRSLRARTPVRDMQDALSGHHEASAIAMEKVMHLA
ncbi:MAG: hypothetical protein ABW178_01905 [Pseudoxanthomonas sp.]